MSEGLSALEERVAVALAAACPDPATCEGGWDACRSRHGVHYSMTQKQRGFGVHEIVSIEGDVAAIARIAVREVLAGMREGQAGRLW